MLQNQTKQNEMLYEILFDQSQIAKKFNTQNQIVKESLRNLFDIIVKLIILLLKVLNKTNIP